MSNKIREARITNNYQYFIVNMLSIVRFILLTSGAIIGAICIIFTIASSIFSIRPVIVISGSMEPTIMTGSLTIGHKIPARQLEIGDIVTVPRPTGGLITHRIVDIKSIPKIDELNSKDSGALAFNNVGVVDFYIRDVNRDVPINLILQGDANEVADSQLYQVSEAYKVVSSVPHLGNMIQIFRTPFGIVSILFLSLFTIFFYLYDPKVMKSK